MPDKSGTMATLNIMDIQDLPVDSDFRMDIQDLPVDSDFISGSTGRFRIYR